MFRTQVTLPGWQHMFEGGTGKRGGGRTGCVCKRVLTTSKGVTKTLIRELGMHIWYTLTLHILVKAVSVEPVAAATSFARKGSIPEGFCAEGVEGTGRLGFAVRRRSGSYQIKFGRGGR